METVFQDKNELVEDAIKRAKGVSDETGRLVKIVMLDGITLNIGHTSEVYDIIDLYNARSEINYLKSLVEVYKGIAIKRT